MEKLIFYAIILLMCSCSGNMSGKNTDQIPLGNRTIQTIEFEGCEYIYLRRYGSVAIEHKGNCKNPIHSAK